MDLSGMLSDLAGCLCATLSAASTPEPCFCGVVPGETVLADLASGCDTRNGVAWVRIASAYPSVTVGQADTRPGNCATGSGLDIEVGVLREVAAYLEPEAVTEAESLAAALLQHDDMASILKAIRCCTTLDPNDYIVGQYRPMGPLGGMIGGAWMLHVGLI